MNVSPMSSKGSGGSRVRVGVRSPSSNLSVSSNCFPDPKSNKSSSQTCVSSSPSVSPLSGYNDLIDEFEKLCDIKGELCSQNKWALPFADDENDKMLVGDDPWP